MNENMLRMALVINTSHDNFIKNLSNILLYLLYNDGSPNQYTADELKDLVEKTIHLIMQPAFTFVREWSNGPFSIISAIFIPFS